MKKDVIPHLSGAIPRFDRGNHAELKIFSNPKALFQFSADDFYHRAMTAVKENGFFSVVLSGGHTPAAFFDILAGSEDYQKKIPWNAIQFFFGDERYVPADDDQSNYHTAYEHLFSKVPIDLKNVFRIPTEFQDPKDAAKNYEQILRKVFHLQETEFPQFDLVYLGLGSNAHTASLMPSSDIVKRCVENPNSNEDLQLVVSLFVTDLNMHRITLTPSALNHAKNIIFLVSGSEKAAAVWNVLEGKKDPIHYPAQLIQDFGHNINWYLDQAAAGKLDSAHFSESTKL